MKKIYAEAGFGNDTFFSTEIEEGDSEYRIPEFKKPENVEDYYLRFWIGRRVFVFSSKDGFKISKKDRTKIKILFGIGGT